MVRSTELDGRATHRPPWRPPPSRWLVGPSGWASILRIRWRLAPSAAVSSQPQVFFGSIEELMDKFSFLRDELGIGSIMVGEVDDLTPVIERMV